MASREALSRFQTSKPAAALYDSTCSWVSSTRVIKKCTDAFINFLFPKKIFEIPTTRRVFCFLLRNPNDLGRWTDTSMACGIKEKIVKINTREYMVFFVFNMVASKNRTLVVHRLILPLRNIPREESYFCFSVLPCFFFPSFFLFLLPLVFFLFSVSFRSLHRFLSSSLFNQHIRCGVPGKRQPYRSLSLSLLLLLLFICLFLLSRSVPLALFERAYHVWKCMQKTGV